MGCGQSKLGNLYPKNKKNKNGSKRNGFSIRSASFEQKNGSGNNKGSKTNNNGAEVNRNEEQNGSLDKSQAKKKPIPPGGGPLLQQTEISSSQLDFFRMLDEKIENGPDYDESTDPARRPEHVTGLLRRWELASASWSTVTDIGNSAGLKHSYSTPPQQQQQQQQLSGRLLGSTQPPQRGPYKPLPPPVSGLSAKDREREGSGMRNIIGGRPESAPVYVQRISSAARLDGLQDMHQQYHCPSPNMPRHVLESISQSPTQNLKTPPGVASPTGFASTSSRYHHPDLQQQQSLKVTKALYGQGPSPLNGEYSPQPNVYRKRDLARQQSLGSLGTLGPLQQQHQQHQSYDSPGPNALIRNSPSNPYVQQFQISSGQPSPGQFAEPRKRPGYSAAQMT